ncbi:hypothetical protein [Pseudomonas phage PhiPizzaParty]|nr:hypothetical protein [Pseudomonas aeruginosa]WNV50282.1 hypothetical protein [Pseudomonas phage PhiPizzaParty]
MSSNKLAAQLNHHHNTRIVNYYVSLAESRYGDTNPSAKAKGKWRKHNPFNCGRSRCMLCGNPRKRWNRLTLNEIKINISLKEQLTEISRDIAELNED